LTDKNTSFECPGTSDIAHSVATATEDKGWHAESFHKFDAVGVTTHAEVEAAKTVARQAVTATLEDDGFWLVISHDSLDDWLKDGLVGNIINAIAEREVDSVVLALANTDVAKLASAWEVLSILVERNSHDTVSGVESLLDTIAVMNINVNVENTLFETKELNDAQDDV
jgi:hypothetical protein